MHRLLGGGEDCWNSKTSCWRATNLVDHRDRDTLNNTRSNLRVCTRSQNQQNSVGKPSQRRSRFKGVSYSKNRKKSWRATIWVNGKQIHGGYFATEEEAARSYDRLAREHFGEFARPNLGVSEIDNGVTRVQ